MAKSGTKEWYKEKYEATAEKLTKAKADIKALKEQIGNAPTACELQVDRSLLDARRSQSISKFIGKAQRYTNREPNQIVAACIAHLADSTRSTPLPALMARIKRLKGTGLGR